MCDQQENQICVVCKRDLEESPSVRTTKDFGPEGREDFPPMHVSCALQYTYLKMLEHEDKIVDVVTNQRRLDVVNTNFQKFKFSQLQRNENFRVSHEFHENNFNELNEKIGELTGHVDANKDLIDKLGGAVGEHEKKIDGTADSVVDAVGIINKNHSTAMDLREEQLSFNNEVIQKVSDLSESFGELVKRIEGLEAFAGTLITAINCDQLELGAIERVAVGGVLGGKPEGQ